MENVSPKGELFVTDNSETQHPFKSVWQQYYVCQHSCSG